MQPLSALAALLLLAACEAEQPQAAAQPAASGRCADSNPEAVAAAQAIPASGLPALTGRVVDGAGMLTPQQAQSLNAMSQQLEARTTDQLVVVTAASLGGHEIDAFGVALGRHWRVGQRDKNNGVLLIVASNERRVRIEVGYGLERILTNERAAEIIRSEILPHFRTGAFAAGISAGSRAIVETLVAQADAPRVGGC
jgi:uncharacterized protein